MPMALSFKTTALHTRAPRPTQQRRAGSLAFARISAQKRTNRSSHRLPFITNPLVRPEVCP